MLFVSPLILWGVMIAFIIHNKVYYEVDLGDVKWRKVTVSGDTVLLTKTGRVLVGPGNIDLCAAADCVFGIYRKSLRDSVHFKIETGSGEIVFFKNDEDFHNTFHRTNNELRDFVNIIEINAMPDAERVRNLCSVDIKLKSVREKERFQ